jgi:catechol 2,3-dioxygenase-like lactoylglutathione lyase family enzyme
MAVRVVAIDHVQLAMPAGREQEADAFYCELLGFAAVPKPEPLAARGGRWYASAKVHVHLGVETAFRPAKKAHPALRVSGFDELLQQFDTHGVSWRRDHELPDLRRVYVDDPFGNRIELIDGSM